MEEQAHCGWKPSTLINLEGCCRVENEESSVNERHSSKKKPHRLVNFKRVDMAAMISDGLNPCEPKSQGVQKDPSDIHTNSLTIFDTTSSYEYTEDSTDDASSKYVACWPCRSCTKSALKKSVILCTILLLFVIGLRVGMVINHGSKSKAATSNVNSQVQEVPINTQGNKTMNPQQATGTSAFDFEFDSEATLAPDEGEENIYDQPNRNYLVGAYYFPWYGNRFHNGEGYLREQLSPQQWPYLGEYDDSKNGTISQHLEWSRRANIGLWVTSWWGPNTLEDNTTKGVILQHAELGNMKIALHYESTKRVNGTDMTNVVNDINYVCKNYFDHPNYFHLNGRPVIFMYNTRELERMGVLEDAAFTMRTSATECGRDVFLVGDHVYNNPPNDPVLYAPFYYFDAVTSYDIYGSMDRPYAGSSVDNYYETQAQWRAKANFNGCGYIPTISPGYNDRGLRLDSDHPPLSRRLDADSEEGSLLWYQLTKAKPLVDTMAEGLLMVNSFNQWHEDTQIEPVAGENASLPEDLTQGLVYQGYGDLYLRILRESTVQNDNVFEKNP